MTQASRSSTSADEAHFQYMDVRRRTQQIAAPLCVEDQVIQSMPDASPTKWHLAHTTWFFERFVLAGQVPGYTPVDDDYFYLFNSYYNSVGPMHARPRRGLLSRPTVAQIEDYRATVDERMLDWLDYTRLSDEQHFLLTLGLHHEQQHQELILTDIKHALGQNPLLPAYKDLPSGPSQACALEFIPCDEQVVAIGHEGSGCAAGAFAFDNETPRHKTLLHAHALANRLVTNGEYRDFVNDGGYQKPELWLSEAWSVINEQGWQRPLYWQADLDSEFTLAGVRSLDVNAPVCHVSLYEADAFARWADARLPTEAELEHAACSLHTSGAGHAAQSLDAEHSARPVTVDGNFYEAGYLHPVAPASTNRGFTQLFGDVWEWTSSAYGPYPGYTPLAGSLGEYNGKFMCSQHVLRGGSCASPRAHLRATYRNFFYADARWQFTGIRLAKDVP